MDKKISNKKNNKITFYFACDECNKFFSTNHNLKRHVNKFHHHHQAEETYICYNCCKNYSTKSNLIKHISRCLNSKNKKLPTIKCLLCKDYKNTKAKLLDHYSVYHDVDVTIKIFIFSDFDEFEIWKDQIEKDDVSRYVRYDIKKTSINTIYYYKCNRDGFYKCAGNHIRRLKIQDTTKINGYCPSKITATVRNETGEVSVDFLPAHVGHNRDLEKIPLKKSDRDLLALKISQDIPFDELLNEIRDDCDLNNVNRIHLVTRKDLYNIKNLYNLNREPGTDKSHLKINIKQNEMDSENINAN